MLVECAEAIAGELFKSRCSQRWVAHAVTGLTGNQTKPYGQDLEAFAVRYRLARDAVLDPSLDTAELDPNTWVMIASAVADRDEISDADWPDGKAEGHHSFTIDVWRELALHFIAKAFGGDRVQLAAWLQEEERTCTEAHIAAHDQLVQPAALKVLTSDLTTTVMRLERHQRTSVHETLKLYYTELERYRTIQPDSDDGEIDAD